VPRSEYYPLPLVVIVTVPPGPEGAAGAPPARTPDAAPNPEPTRPPNVRSFQDDARTYLRSRFAAMKAGRAWA
jgi:hypothetical protein